MDQTLKYANILTEVLRAEARQEFSLTPNLKQVVSCDRESGQFLLIMIGWDNRQRWHHSITFHAQLRDGKVIIETNMTEDLHERLREAGIRAEDLVSGDSLPMAAQAAAA